MLKKLVVKLVVGQLAVQLLKHQQENDDEKLIKEKSKDSFSHVLPFSSFNFMRTKNHPLK